MFVQGALHRVVQTEKRLLFGYVLISGHEMDLLNFYFCERFMLCLASECLILE